jgi:hypothetical protein
MTAHLSDVGRLIFLLLWWLDHFVVDISVFIDKLVVLSCAPPPWLLKELTFLLLRSSSS